MGIDIYLNGYEAHKVRIADIKLEFDAAVIRRDQATTDGLRSKGSEDDAYQKAVSEKYGAMYQGKTGYIRSSYNGSGLFRVLEEIFGFDVAEYLFPGDWDAQGDDGISIDGKAFVGKVENLQRTAIVAMNRKQFTLPWIEVFTEVSGERAPDGNEAHNRAEAFGDSVFQMLSGAFETDKIEGGPSESSPTLGQRHIWYLTRGLGNLYDFGKLAEQLAAKGGRTYALISY